MAAHEDHTQLVVPELLFDAGIVRRRHCGARQFEHDRVGLVPEQLPAAYRVDRGIVRDSKEPRRGVVRHAGEWPGLKRTQHGVLHALFS